MTATGQGKLRSAVIGTGKISEEHLRFLGTNPMTRLAGVCDLSPALARYAADRFGAEGSYTDSRRMLERARPDVVHVLTPPHTHVALVTDCLAYGAHVIVEKPIAPTPAEFEDLWATSQRLGKVLIENHNYRFNRPIQRMLAIVEAGEIGSVREVEVRMNLGIRGAGGRYADRNLPHPSHRMPAGVIHEFITHLSYLLLLFLPDFEDVSAAWSNIGKADEGDVFKFDDLDARITGQGGSRGRIRFSCHQWPDCFTVTVRGSAGVLETDLFQPHLRRVVARPVGSQLTPLMNQWCNGWTLAGASVSGFWAKLLQKTPYEGLSTFLDLAYGSIAREQEPPVTYDDMDRAIRLIDAMVRSGKQGEKPGVAA